MGFGELILETGFFRKFVQTGFQLILRKGWSNDPEKFSIELNRTIGPFVLGSGNVVFPLAFFIQVWYGYGETLLNYDKSYLKIRGGISLVLD
jgi:outer membrane phospholipase A